MKLTIEYNLQNERTTDTIEGVEKAYYIEDDRLPERLRVEWYQGYDSDYDQAKIIEIIDE